jgi:hypothetical protein
MPVMRHLLLPAPEDVVRIWQTDRKLATATARPHQAICELDPTLLSPMVEPTKRSQNRGMALPSPIASARSSSVAGLYRYCPTR